MLRWIAILLVAALVLFGFMAWRTVELLQPPPTLSVSVANGPPIAYDMPGASKRLSAAITFRTVTDANGAPQSLDEFTSFTNWIRQSFPALNTVATFEPIPDSLSFLYTWKGTDERAPPILFLAHLDVPDVAPSEAKAWSHPPFFGSIGPGPDGKPAIHGRGALQGKSNLMGVLEAANALAATGFKPERTILIAVAHDGETRGAKGAKALATTLAARGTRAWFAVDQGLGVVARAPLTDKPAALIGVVEKPEGVLRVAASAKGSGVGGRGKAVAELAEALIVLRAAAPHVSVDDPITLGTIKALTADLSPVRAFLLANAWACEPILKMQDDLDTQAMLSTTAAPLRLAEGPSGGADEAQAFVSIRLHPTDSANAFVNRARKALTPYPSIVVAWEDPPPPVARPARSNSDSYLLLASVARRATGAPPAPSLYVLSSTGRFFEGVAKDVYRFTPAYWMPRQLDSLSGADAYLPVTEYQRMIGFYAQLMAEASR